MTVSITTQEKAAADAALNDYKGMVADGAETSPGNGDVISKDDSNLRLQNDPPVPFTQPPFPFQTPPAPVPDSPISIIAQQASDNNMRALYLAVVRQLKSLFRVSAFEKLAVDFSTNSATYVPVLSKSITMDYNGFVLINFAASMSSNNNLIAQYRLKVNGTPVNYASAWVGAVSTSLSIVHREPCVAGTVLIEVEAQVSGNILYIRSFSQPQSETASLMIVGSTT